MLFNKPSNTYIMLKRDITYVEGKNPEMKPIAGGKYGKSDQRDRIPDRIFPQTFCTRAS